MDRNQKIKFLTDRIGTGTPILVSLTDDRPFAGIVTGINVINNIVVFGFINVNNGELLQVPVDSVRELGTT